MEYVKDGFQVMVFVHSRNDTNKTARTFLELMTEFPDAKGKYIYITISMSNRYFWICRDFFH